MGMRHAGSLPPETLTTTLTGMTPSTLARDGFNYNFRVEVHAEGESGVLGATKNVSFVLASSAHLQGNGPRAGEHPEAVGALVNRGFN